MRPVSFGTSRDAARILGLLLLGSHSEDGMQDTMHALFTDVVLFAPRLLGSIGIFAAFWIAAVVVRAIVVRMGTTRLVHQDIVGVLAQGLKVSVLALGLITALGTSGFNVAGLVAGLGLTGFAVGFALKDVLANVVAGAIILTYRPFRPADRVVVAGFEGRVTEIDMRYTTLDTGDRCVLVPNSTALTSAVSVLDKPASATTPASPAA